VAIFGYAPRLICFCRNYLHSVHPVVLIHIMTCYATEDAVRLLIGFITILQVVTTITYYAVTFDTAYTPISSVYPQ
jgi:hypothetical protein